MSVRREYAGAERDFRLGFGDLLDLEQACGALPVGTIYKRLHAWDFRARDVFEVVRLGLIGGGMAADEAKRIVIERFDVLPLERHVTIAMAILLDMMEGAPEARDPGVDKGEAKPLDRGLLYKNFAQLGIPPREVDAMSVEQALHLFEATSRTAADMAPSEAEFEAMMKRLDSPEMAWARAPAPKQ